MSEKKSCITRADALKAAIAYAQADGNEQVADVLGRMLASITRPRAKQTSKARLVNERLAAWLRDYVSANGDGVTASEIAKAGNPAIASSQKAASVAKVACELGYLARNKSGKVTTYYLA
jgi:hypothetical protein